MWTFHYKNVRSYSTTATCDKVMVVGGFGTFGKLYCERVLKNVKEPVTIVIAGRNVGRSTKVTEELRSKVPDTKVKLEHYQVDAFSEHFRNVLQKEKPFLVVNTCGPFKFSAEKPEENYRMAKDCIAAKCNYIDLAESRAFVNNFSKQLDKDAKDNGVLLVTGASTVPSLTTAIVDHDAPEFKTLKTIDISMNTGNKTPRGLSTIQSVLEYCGKPFTQKIDGVYKTVYGFMGVKSQQFTGLRRNRLVSFCDVPDSDLLAARFPTAETVTFRAGVELWAFQMGIYLLALLKRFNIVSEWQKYAATLKSLSDPLTTLGFGTDQGGLNVTLTGTDQNGERNEISRSIYAGSGHGPYIPITPALILTEKMLSGKLKSPGAYPAVGLHTLEEFKESVKDLDILFFGKTNKTPTLFARNFPPEHLEMMPSKIRKFHEIGGKVEGRMDVVRGKGWLRNLLADIGGLPGEQKGGKVTVDVDNGAWHRVFQSPDGKVHHMTSRWKESKSHGLTIEEFHHGLVRVGFQLKPVWKDNKVAGFEHTFQRLWIAGIPIPDAITMKATGGTYCHEDGNGWDVHVTVTLPLLGQILYYHGIVNVVE